MTTIGIEPHADDLFLGCYSLLKLGLIDKIITVADCGEKRKQENINMEEYFGIEPANRHYLTYPTSFPDGDLISNITKIYDRIKRDIDWDDIVFLPSKHDEHLDHKAISGLDFDCRKIIEYCIWNRPNDVLADVWMLPEETEKRQLFKKFYPSQSTLLQERVLWFPEFFKVRK